MDVNYNSHLLFTEQGQWRGRRIREKGERADNLTWWWSDHEGRRAVVRPAVEFPGATATRRGKKKKMQKKRICREEREDLAVAVPIAGEDLGWWEGWDAVCWWRRNVSVGSLRAEEATRREREERTLAGRKTREKLVFWLILNLIFSSLGPSNPPLFIGGERRQSFSCWGKISALDSLGKDSNRWLKVGMVHCQNCRNGCLSWHV